MALAGQRTLGVKVDRLRDGVLVSPVSRRFWPVAAPIVPPHVHVLGVWAEAVPAPPSARTAAVATSPALMIRSSRLTVELY
jgi:hypothetical protein